MTPTSGTTTGRFYTRLWVKICGGIAGMLVLILLLLPVGAKYFITDWLEKNGADSASIKSLWYNPFKGSITLEGMNVRAGGKSLLSDSRIEMNIGLGSLFSHNLRLEKAVYQDLNIDIEQYKDGKWRFASYTMDGAGKEEKTFDSSKDVASAWAFLADNVVFRNCTVHLKTVDLETTLVIKEAVLNDFTTRAGKSTATFILKGQLDDGPVVIDLDHLQIFPDLVLGGNVSLSQIDLGVLANMLKDSLHPFSGIAGLKGKVLFSQSSQEGMVVDYDGTINLVDPELGNDAFLTKSGQLNWKGSVHYTAADNGPMVITTDGLLSAQQYSLGLPEVGFLLHESGIDLDGKTTVTIADTVVVASESSLDVKGTDLQLPDMSITEDSLSWKGKVDYFSNHDGAGMFVDTNGTFDLGSYVFDKKDGASPFTSSGKKINWQGRIAYGMEKDAAGDAVILDGALVGELLQTDLKNQSLRLEQGKVQLTAKGRIALEAASGLSGESSLLLDSFKVVDLKNEISLLTLDSFAVNGLQAPGGKKVTVDNIRAGGLIAAVAGEFPLHVTIPEIELKTLATDDMASLSIGNFLIKEPQVTADKNNSELIFLQNVKGDNILVDSSAAVSAGLVSLDGLRFLKAENGPDAKTVLSLGSANLSQFNWSKDTGLYGDTLELHNVLANIVRDKDGALNINSQLQKMKLKPAQSASTTADVNVEDGKSPQTPFGLKMVKMSGASNLYFKDYTLAVPFTTDLSISSLEIGEIDSAKPELKTTVSLKGMFVKRAPLEVIGTISPFLPKISVKMKVKVKNYPLDQLSPYTVQSVGTALAEGQLKIKTKLTLDNDVLDMENNIVLKKLKTKTIAPDLAAELNNQLPIPLDTALAMLRDSKGNIELNIPLSGPVSDLNVGISDIIITALGKAIIPAASSYLVYSLGPYGALAYVGMKVGEKILQVNLPPVVFAAQESSVTDEHKKYLERVGKILQDRPETDMQICPYVASWEYLTEDEIKAVKGKTVEIDEKNRQRLVQLGQDRANSVKKYLQDNFSIDVNRLLLCDTVIETEKEAVPEVKLLL